MVRVQVHIQAYDVDVDCPFAEQSPAPAATQSVIKYESWAWTGRGAMCSGRPGAYGTRKVFQGVKMCPGGIGPVSGGLLNI